MLKNIELCVDTVLSDFNIGHSSGSEKKIINLVLAIADHLLERDYVDIDSNKPLVPTGWITPKEFEQEYEFVVKERIAKMCRSEPDLEDHCMKTTMGWYIDPLAFLSYFQQTDKYPVLSKKSDKYFKKYRKNP